MKKNIFAAGLLTFAFAAAAALPSFAENAKKQAQDINAEGQAAVNADTPSDARGIGNTAWDNAGKNAGTSVGEGTVNPSDLDEHEKQEHNTGFHNPQFVPDVSETKDVTPWKAESKALKYLFMGAMLLLSTAAVLADTPKGKAIAITLSSIAIAASIAAVGLALTIMFKYGQYAYGGMWLAVAGAGLAACAVACIAGTKAYNAAKTNAQATINVYLKVILTLFGLGGTFLANTIGNEAEGYIDKDAAKKYCTENKDHAGCKTSTLPYELRDIPAEIDIMDC